MNIHSILPEEIAAMGGHSNRVLNEKTGCIGYLTANLNASAPVFESSWHDRTPRLNTPEFTDDFNDMMDLFEDLLSSAAKELLGSYQRLSAQNVKGENITSTLFNIAGMMHTVADAFEKQLDSLYAEEAMDISADITVFETLLKQEGFVDEDKQEQEEAKK